MGAALDSFMITVEYAGIVTIVLLALCLISRFRNNSGSLNVFQRMPLLLPALGFVITVMLVASMGIIPMAQYQGVNSQQYYAENGEIFSFNQRDQEFYSHSFQVYSSYYLELNDSIYIDVFVSQDGILIDTLALDIEYSSIQDPVTGRVTIALNPGTYDVQVNFTRYYGGLLEEDPGHVQITISQPLIEGFTEEIVDWSSFQFAINISCIMIILGGLCIGSSTKRERKKDETDWKTTSEYEY